ncbi:MAG: MmcQ/YjbR family DNA-binding protein [bacterium]|nr:MmcQ/YjbR family DNA-binding protein [bacterium]
MNERTLLDFCLAKAGAWLDTPWENDVVVKVGPKVFAFTGEGAVGLKCGTRDEADEWLARYPGDACVMPYLGRSGWNSLKIDGAIPDDELYDAIDGSYDYVVSNLAKRDRPTARPD